MYSRLHFANYSLLRIRDLSGPYRHRCTPQKKLCWHKEGENTCLPQTELSTSQVFSVYSFQVGKLIPFLLLPVEFTILCCVLCEVRTERGIDRELSVVYGISLWFVPYSVSILDNCFWLVFRGSCFLMIIPLLPLGFGSFQCVYHYSWLRCTI